MRGPWYFHRFYDFQPDLNTENPEVREEIKRIMGYWLEQGVSGFRVDALPFVISKKGRDPQSFLNWTERIIRMRKECPEIGWGDWRILRTGSPHVLALRYDWRGNAIVAVHNTDGQPHKITLNIENAGRTSLVNLLSNDHSEGDGDGVHRLGIEGYGYRWYRVGGLDYILRRSRM